MEKEKEETNHLQSQEKPRKFYTLNSTIELEY